MNSKLEKTYSLFDANELPKTEILRNGRVLRNRRLIASPFTTGENVFVLQTTFYADPENTKSPDAKELKERAHKHDTAEEIMIFDHEALVYVDGEVLTVPAGGTVVAKPGCWHGCGFVDPTVDAMITCIFTPSIPEDEDPGYPELVRITKEFVDSLKNE